jgi:hypothetical protein
MTIETKDGWVIETDEPKTSGRYVCFMHGLAVPTAIRFWCVGTGWMSNINEGQRIAGTVAGWIGPLPTWMENGSRPALNIEEPEVPQEFDL